MSNIKSIIFPTSRHTLTSYSIIFLMVASMAGGYAFSYALAPLQSILETSYGWTPEIYGRYCSAASFLNVFCLVLIFGGVAVDKIGAPKAGIASLLMMITGIGLNYLAMIPDFCNHSFVNTLSRTLSMPNAWWNITPLTAEMPASARVATIGLMIFGSGMEICGIAVSRITISHFLGKGLSLSMGLQLGCARMMMALSIWASPRLASIDGDSVRLPLAACLALTFFSLITFITYSISARRNTHTQQSIETPFSWNILRQLLCSKTFIFPAIVCMLYYGSVYPFMRFGVMLMQEKMNISAADASQILFLLPLGSALILPPICRIVDKKRIHLQMLRCGTLILIPALLYFMLPFNAGSNSLYLSVIAISLASLSTAFVAASVWPIVAETLPSSVLGTAYGSIYWLQGVALMLIPIAAGNAMHSGSDINFSSTMLVFIIPASVAAVASLLMKQK